MEGLLAYFATVPTWVWILMGVLLLMIFKGDRGLWDYEAKFPLNPEVGRGEVEFESFKKGGTKVEAKFYLEEAYANRPIEIYLSNRLVCTIPSEKNKAGRIYFQQPIRLEKPVEGEKVTVLIEGKQVFEGPIIRD